MKGYVQNGLTRDQEDQIAAIVVNINMAIGEVHNLPDHRSISLAMTKLEESRHWLQDRLVTPS